MAIIDRVRKAWNAFIGLNTYSDYDLIGNTGPASLTYGGISPSRPRLRYSNDRSIISSIMTRISIDVSDVVFRK